MNETFDLTIHFPCSWFNGYDNQIKIKFWLNQITCNQHCVIPNWPSNMHVGAAVGHIQHCSPISRNLIIIWKPCSRVKDQKLQQQFRFSKIRKWTEKRNRGWKARIFSPGFPFGNFAQQEDSALWEFLFSQERRFLHSYPLNGKSKFFLSKKFS